MDPLTVIRTLWAHKWVAFTVMALTLVACVYVYLFAPRNYEAAVTYAVTAPNMPSAEERLNDKKLANLNADNPYLRSADSSLLTQVVIAKLTDPAYVKSLKDTGMATDFTIIPVASLGMGLVSLTAVSDSEQESVATAKFLGDEFTATLKAVQKVNGADDRFLYEPILVRGPGPAVEQFSNRLRSLIMVGIAGGLALFAAVSVAQSVTLRKKRLAADADSEETPHVALGLTQHQPDDGNGHKARTKGTTSIDSVEDSPHATHNSEVERGSGKVYQRH